MANIFEISYLCPLKAYPVTDTPGKHFDDDWAHKQILSFERNVRYYQKWEKSDNIIFQVISNFQPSFKLLQCGGAVEPTTLGNLTQISYDPNTGATLYEANIDMSGVADGYYYPVTEATFLDVSFKVIFEPIHVMTKHNNTSVFKFSNSLNDFGVVFSGTIDATNEPYTPEFIFRCEAAVMDFEPDGERSSYKDQVLNVTTLSATPSRKFTLYIGEAPGVAPWVVDVLNRIFSCDHVAIDNLGAGKFLQYEREEGAKWEVTRVRGYPLIGAKVDLVEAKNRSGLQLSDDTVPAGGIIVGYNIETDAFGTFNAPSSTNPIQVQTVDS